MVKELLVIIGLPLEDILMRLAGLPCLRLEILSSRGPSYTFLFFDSIRLLKIKEEVPFDQRC